MDKPEEDRVIAQAARRHDFSAEAARVLAGALKRAGGAMAQFSHPELGGMGQYARGGMLMIGDMFNDALKGRVRQLADELAASLDFDGGPAASAAQADVSGAARSARWWPEALGEPASRGGQNGIRYAFFPAHRRLAVERNGAVRVHDTMGHAITGVSQQQGTSSSLRFSDRDGSVELDDLPVVP